MIDKQAVSGIIKVRKLPRKIRWRIIEGDFMLTEERHLQILNYLEEKQAVTVAELTKLLDSSESTIRRDLTILDKQKKLKKVHGGATRLEQEFVTMEYDVGTKTNLNQEEKEKIARYAASLVKKDDMVYLDAGTTTEKMIDYLTEKRATFVTNGIVHAKKLMHKGIKTIVIGGRLKETTEAVIGVEAVENLRRYNFTKCFMGANGISKEGGFTTPTSDEAVVKREAIRRSFAAYILADHTKFLRTTAFTFAQLNEACVITDRKPKQQEFKEVVIKEVLQ